MPMPAYKFTPNMPAQVEIKYLDVVGGQYGAQVRLKGKIDGRDEVAYLPGRPVADVLTTLHQAGVITAIPAEIPEGPNAKPIALSIGQRRVTMTLSQPAGERYGQIVCTTNGAAPAQAAPAPTPAPAQALPMAQAAQAATAAAGQVQPELDALYWYLFDSTVKRLQSRARELTLNGEPIPCDMGHVAQLVATQFIAATRRT